MSMRNIPSPIPIISGVASAASSVVPLDFGEKEMGGDEFAIDLKITAGKNFSPKSKYCVVYQVLVDPDESILAAAGKRLTLINTSTRVTTSDKDGFLKFLHKTQLKWTDPAITTLKLSCYNTKTGAVLRSCIGEIVIPLDTMPSGIEKKKWVKLKLNGEKKMKALMLAVRYLDPTAVKFLENIVQLSNEQETTSLYKENYQSIPPNIMVNFKTGMTALHEACLNNWTELGRELVRNNADCTVLDKKGRMPIMLSCKMSNEELTDIMLTEGNIVLNDELRHSLLDYSCKGQSVELVNRFVQDGWDPSHITPGSKTPLHFAAESGSDEQVQILLEKGVHPDVECSSNGSTPLILAIKNAHSSCVRLLLDSNSNPNHDGYFLQPAMLAVNNGDAETLKVLMEPQYNLILPRFHKMALHSASGKGFVEILKLLAPKTPKLLNEFYNEKTCLHSAILGKHAKTVRYLLELSADPNIPCKQWSEMENVSPVIMAVKLGCHNILNILLNQPTIDVNAPCSWDLYECSNLTALHVAVLVENLEAFVMLLSHPDIGVSRETKTKSPNTVWKKRTPEEFAYRKGLTDFISELSGGKSSLPKSERSLTPSLSRKRTTSSSPSLLSTSTPNANNRSLRRRSREFIKSALTVPFSFDGSKKD